MVAIAAQARIESLPNQWDKLMSCSAKRGTWRKINNIIVVVVVAVVVVVVVV